jgi:SAM-dependent methyltransferase
MLDTVQQEKFKTIWEKGNYRMGSTAQRLVPFLLNNIPETATINDYGCGTGRAEVEIYKVRPNQKINMYDITIDALEPTVKDLIGIRPLTFTEVDLADLGNIPKADWGMCINTLMVVQIDKLDLILSELKRTCNNLIVEMYDLPGFRCGWDLTTVKMNSIQWMEKLSEHWKFVSFTQSKESKRRYIFICKDEVC